MLEYQSISALCAAAEEAGVSLSELVLRDQAEEMELPTEVLYQRMRENLQVMRQAIQAGSMPETRSLSGLTGGDAFKMKRYAQEGGIIGGFMNRSIARALAVSEYNAAMGKVVASPTAGSCGILPGTVVSMLEEGKCTEEAAVMALFTAGAVGMVIAQQASIAGAQGGCQAECGSASAMAAAALVELCGGTPTQATPAPWPSKTSWGWCVTPWRVWWRFPVSSAMFPGYPLPLPQRKWPWRELRARFRWTNVSRR